MRARPDAGLAVERADADGDERRIAGNGDPDPDEDAYDTATGGLAGAIDAAWTAGDLEACNRLEVRLWLDGPAGPEGRVSGPPRELALEMNRIVLANDRIVLANGASDVDGASGLDTASRVHEIAVPAIVACGDLDVPTKVRRSAELADTLRHATYRSLPGRAHLPYLEAPDEGRRADHGARHLTVGRSTKRAASQSRRHRTSASGDEHAPVPNVTTRSLRTTSESADRSRADACFALAERASEEAGASRLVLVQGERLA